jgi:hypothetical protein
MPDPYAQDLEAGFYWISLFHEKPTIAYWNKEEAAWITLDYGTLYSGGYVKILSEKLEFKGNPNAN